MNTKVIGEIVAREIRIAGMTREPAPILPAPADIDAEAECLSGLLCADVLPSDLVPLAAEHFYSDIFRAIWLAAVASAPGDLVEIRQRLHTSGWLGAVSEELVQLTAYQPFRSRARLREHVARIIELARRRKLIEVMRRVDIELRCDVLDVDSAAARLAEACK